MSTRLSILKLRRLPSVGNLSFACLLSAATACSEAPPSFSSSTDASGGAPSNNAPGPPFVTTGGQGATGGALTIGTGGIGSIGAGGNQETGGGNSGGSLATGGSGPSTGGQMSSGGATGGTTAEGGAQATGGAQASGGAAQATGGTSGAGGTLSSGGAPGSTGGQSGSTGGQANCAPSDEICDGLDNNCSGSEADEVCSPNCVGRAFANNGYMFCSLDSTQAMAAAECLSSANRTLVEINNAAENSFIIAVASERAWSGPWLGATDKGSEGDWRWPSTTKFWNGDQDGNAVGNRFSAWAPGNPNDGEDGQDCAVLCTQTNTLACSSVGVWNDVSCDTARVGFVCETP